MSYFKDAQVGDKVWDYIYGEGEIVLIDDTASSDLKHESYLIKVDFDNALLYYYPNGKREYNELYQRLFYYDNRPIVITQDDLELHGADNIVLTEGGMFKNKFVTTNPDLIGYNHFSIKDYSEDKYTRKVRRETLKETCDNSKINLLIQTVENTTTIINCSCGTKINDVPIDCAVKCPTCGKYYRLLYTDAEECNKTHLRGIRLPDGCKYLRCRVNGNEFVIEIESEKIGTPADFKWA